MTIPALPAGRDRTPAGDHEPPYGQGDRSWSLKWSSRLSTVYGSPVLRCATGPRKASALWHPIRPLEFQQRVDLRPQVRWSRRTEAGVWSSSIEAVRRSRCDRPKAAGL